MKMSSSSGPVDEGLRRLLRFLTDAELEALGVDLGLRDSIDEEHILGATSDLPRYAVVRLFLKAATPTLILLRQVFDALEALGVHARTTGCLFVLANPTRAGERTELLFSPQAVGMVATWSMKQRGSVKRPLHDLESTWLDFGHVWQGLLHDAKPNRREGEIDVFESYLAREEIRERDTYRVDVEAQEVLLYLMVQVAGLHTRLAAAPPGSLPRPLQTIRDGISDLLDQFVEVLQRSDRNLEYGESGVPSEDEWLRSGGAMPVERPDEYALYRTVSEEFVSEFDRFLEDVYLLADLVEGETLLDLLRLDIWSSRPQLYEVWVMLSILRWLDTQGYKVELRRARSSPNTEPFEWDLAYSRDSRPCATVFESPSRPVGHLFYQLYRPSGDMPDISMLERADASSAPLWSLDPKHSPRAGYGLADYRRTAERYRDSFGAKLSLVAECFPRPWSNPTDFGEGAKLIVDCNPSGPGLPLLLAELQAFHPKTGRLLLCVDLSSSFAGRRDDALQGLRSRLRASGDEHRLIEEYVCFAGTAVSFSNTAGWLMGGALENPGLKGGTEFLPLYAAIANLVKAARVRKVVLVTDGEFDIPLEVAKVRLKTDLGVEVEVFQ